MALAKSVFALKFRTFSYIASLLNSGIARQQHIILSSNFSHKRSSKRHVFLGPNIPLHHWFPEPNRRELDDIGRRVSSLSKSYLVVPAEGTDADVKYIFLVIGKFDLK
jgi:hypothetical protein